MVLYMIEMMDRLLTTPLPLSFPNTCLSISDSPPYPSLLPPSQRPAHLLLRHAVEGGLDLLPHLAQLARLTTPRLLARITLPQHDLGVTKPPPAAAATAAAGGSNSRLLRAELSSRSISRCGQEGVEQPADSSPLSPYPAHCPTFSRAAGSTSRRMRSMRRWAAAGSGGVSAVPAAAAACWLMA
jgi:hypothetical protein